MYEDLGSASMINQESTAQGRTKRKRASPDEKDVSDENRKRGRPRVEPQTESAADRRRTQIRLAQRAYRQRKESTLDELRRQVSDLQDTVRSMNQTFQTFAEQCSGSENVLPSQLVAGLKQVSDQYTSIARATHDTKEDSPLSNGDVEKRLSVVNVMPEDLPQVETTRRSHHLPVVNATESIHIGMGYTATMNNSGMSHQLSQGSQYTFGNRNASSYPRDDNMSQSIENIPPRPLSRSMTLGVPYTYSFQETTFARRLHRASIELAYRLSCDMNRNRAKSQLVFDMWLKWVPSIKHIQDQLREVLVKDTTEPLSLWHFPLIHIGGAGTHYPRQEVSGTWKDKPSDWNVRLTQAPTTAIGSRPEEEYDSQRAMIDVVQTNPAYQGEWFDAYDVEGYLVERGINIDTQSSFLDVELPISEVIESENEEMRRNPDTSASSDSSGSRGSNASINTTRMPSTTSPPVFRYGDYNNFNMAGFSTVGYSDAATGSFVNMLPNSAADPYMSMRSTADCNNFGMNMGIAPGKAATGYNNQGIFLTNAPAPMPLTKMVTIDVSKFIMTVARTGQCLGRCPGYRRYNVDAALRECIMHDL